MRFVVREQDQRWTWALYYGDTLMARGTNDYASESQARAAADAFARGVKGAEQALRGRNVGGRNSTPPQPGAMIRKPRA